MQQVKQPFIRLRTTQARQFKLKIIKPFMYFFLLLYLLITGFPVIWMIISSFKTNTEYFANPWGLPNQWNFTNYIEAWQQGVQQYFLNSIFITSVTVISILLIAAMISFILARRPFRGSKLILSFFLLGMLIPIHSTLIPLFILMKHLHFLDTYAALYFPYVAFGLPMAIFLSYGFFQQIPKALEEAAYIDGANIYQIFGKILLPIIRPILATVAIITTIHTWNEFVFALVLISQDSLRTLPIGLMAFKGMDLTDYATMSAALVITSMPIIIVYMLMSEMVTKGMAAGAVKG